MIRRRSVSHRSTRSKLCCVSHLRTRIRGVLEGDLGADELGDMYGTWSPLKRWGRNGERLMSSRNLACFVARNPTRSANARTLRSPEMMSRCSVLPLARVYCLREAMTPNSLSISCSSRPRRSL